MKSLAALLLVITLLSATSAHARSLDGYTVDWVSHDSDLIIEGAVKSGEMTALVGDMLFTKVRFSVIRVLKGPLSPGDDVTIWGYRQKDPLGLTQGASVGRKLLVFAKVAENTFRELDGRYTFGDYGFVQTTFSLGGEPAFELGGKKYWLYDDRFSRVASYSALVDRVITQVAKEYELRRIYTSSAIELKKTEAPHGSEAQRDLPGMSGTFIMDINYVKPEK